MNPRPPALAPSLSLPGGRSGFTLVELMIAIAIGLVMLVALLTLFINTSRSNSEMAKANSLIDNGRFAMQLLESDIIHAGFWGTHLPQFDDLNETTAPNDIPSAVPDPCLTYSATNWNDSVALNEYKHNLIGIPIQAYETAPTSCAEVVTNKLDNTDMLVVRHAETCVPGLGACEADTTGKLYFQSSLCTTPPSYVFGTANYDGLKRCTSVDYEAERCSPLGSCGQVADKRKFISHIYYIRNYAMTAGDGIPTLVRSEFDLADGTLAHQAAVPLIEGIEGLHVEFGIDNKSRCNHDINYAEAINLVDPLTCALNTNTEKNILPDNRGDGTPDEFKTASEMASAPLGACTIAGTHCYLAANVVAVKLYVLARAKDGTPGYTDRKTYSLGRQKMCITTDTSCEIAERVLDPGFKRHVFSTTVRLTNVSVRREAP